MPLIGVQEILNNVVNAAQTAIKVEGNGTPGTPSSTPTTTQGIAYAASANFTRPNDTNAYAALDVMANATSGASVLTFSGIGPTGGGSVILANLALRMDTNAIPSGMAGFRLHLYNAQPTAVGDNAAFDLPSGDAAKYLGFIEVPTPLDLGSTLWTECEALNLPIRKEIVVPAGGAIYGIVQTIAAFTPAASVVHTLTLNGLGV